MEDGEWVLVRPPTEIECWSPGWGGGEDEGGSSDPLKVRFFGPAKHWTDALPIGNGRLGAMVWGGVASETLQLNGKSLLFSVWLLRKGMRVNVSWSETAKSFPLGLFCFGFWIKSETLRFFTLRFVILVSR